MSREYGVKKIGIKSTSVYWLAAYPIAGISDAFRNYNSYSKLLIVSLSLILLGYSLNPTLYTYQQGTGGVKQQVLDSVSFVHQPTTVKTTRDKSPLADTAPQETTSLIISKKATGDAAGVKDKKQTVFTSAYLIEALKTNGLWGASPAIDATPFMINSFPLDLEGVDVSLKKRIFFNALAPVVMFALQEIREERLRLIDIINVYSKDPSLLHFSDTDKEWQKMLSPNDVYFITGLTRKYKHTNASELLNRVDVLPISLVLAQGAIESSWGTSRFANLGNNLFGVWTWGEKGIVPLNRTKGLTHKVAAYDSILDSVRAYLLTLNRVAAYGNLRRLRTQTMDSVTLAKGLSRYSARGETYVRSVQRIINANNLVFYDAYSLASNIE